jgi:hypothetical protein
MRSGRVPLRTCRGKNDCHCCHSSAIGQRLPEPVATTSAAQTVAPTCVMSQPYGNQCRYVWGGGRPGLRAVS